MDYLATIKEMSPKRKKENLILLLVLLVILLISLNYIFGNEKKEEETTVKENIQEQVTNKNSIEERISEVLSQINGVSEVSVVINYTNDGVNEVVYDTKEAYSENGNVVSVEKSVAYNEQSGQKTAIISLKNSPAVEGVIVVANGVSNSEMKQKIATALGNLLGIASYKVQVFEK